MFSNLQGLQLGSGSLASGSVLATTALHSLPQKERETSFLPLPVRLWEIPGPLQVGRGPGGATCPGASPDMVPPFTQSVCPS